MRNVLPRIVRDWDHPTEHAFALNQRCQRLPGGPADWVNRRCFGTQPLENPGDVDPPAPWIAVGLRASHLREGHHFFD